MKVWSESWSNSFLLVTFQLVLTQNTTVRNQDGVFTEPFPVQESWSFVLILHVRPYNKLRFISVCKPSLSCEVIAKREDYRHLLIYICIWPYSPKTLKPAVYSKTVPATKVNWPPLWLGELDGPPCMHVTCNSAAGYHINAEHSNKLQQLGEHSQ